MIKPTPEMIEAVQSVTWYDTQEDGEEIEMCVGDYDAERIVKALAPLLVPEDPRERLARTIYETWCPPETHLSWADFRRIYPEQTIAYEWADKVATASTPKPFGWPVTPPPPAAPSQES